VEMAIGLLDFAQANLCIHAGCDPEEAAARLGYAAWNLEHAFESQLEEAVRRDEVARDLQADLAARALGATESCLMAREALLASQPQLPDESRLTEAKVQSAACALALRSIAESL
jgi:hypothetical protein